MKSNIFIIFAVSTIVITTIIFGAIFMSERNEQRELSLDQRSLATESISESKKGTKYDSKVLECFSHLFHCDASSEYFEGCINGKKDGVTIEEICTSSTIAVDDGCTTVEFEDNYTMITCE